MSDEDILDFDVGKTFCCLLFAGPGDRVVWGHYDCSNEGLRKLIGGYWKRAPLGQDAWYFYADGLDPRTPRNRIGEDLLLGHRQVRSNVVITGKAVDGQVIDTPEWVFDTVFQSARRLSESRRPF